jgi:hypothetical protein
LATVLTEHNLEDRQQQKQTASRYTFSRQPAVGVPDSPAADAPGEIPRRTARSVVRRQPTGQAPCGHQQAFGSSTRAGA